MKKRLILSLVLVIAAAILSAPLWPTKKTEEAPPPPPPPAAPEPSYRLSEGDFFFTEPYTNLDPPVTDQIAMSLELDYARVRFEHGLANTVDPANPPVNYRKRLAVKGDAALKRILDATKLKAGDKVTVVSKAGKVYPAEVVGFSYYGNSPSTVIVAADLKILSPSVDETMLKAHGVALRGEVKIAPFDVGVKPPLPAGDATADKLVKLCAGEVPAGLVVEDQVVTPAALAPGEAPHYFVSLWQRPETGFEIEDVELKSCVFKPQGETYVKLTTPFPVELISVFDLDGDKKAELFAMTGGAAEICYIYLAPNESGYRVLKRGLCAGY